MKEINLVPNQFLNLTAQGNPSGKLIIQNQGKDVMYVFKQPTTPIVADPSYALFAWQSVEVDNSAADIWVASQQAGTMFVSSSSDLAHQTMEFPSDMVSGNAEGFRRLRVDQGETGFFNGKMFRSFIEGVIPTAGPTVQFRFTCPVDFILWSQQLELTQGALQLEVYRDAIPSGTWTQQAVIGLNRMAQRQTPYYTPVATFETGGNFTGGVRTDLMRIRTAAANNTASNVGGSFSERGLPAGVYCGRLSTLTGGLTVNDAAQYKYNLEWEERP